MPKHAVPLSAYNILWHNQPIETKQKFSFNFVKITLKIG